MRSLACHVIIFEQLLRSELVIPQRAAVTPTPLSAAWPHLHARPAIGVGLCYATAPFASLQIKG